MKSIIITTSPQISSLTNFFIAIAKQFSKRGYKVIVIFDNQRVREIKDEDLIYYTWPSKRPTKLKDFIFLKNIILKFKPEYIISSFGAVNASLITSYFLRVPNRIAWYHTKSNQVLKDTKNRFKSNILKSRKSLILNLFSTEIHTNSLDTKKDANEYLKLPLKKIKVIYFLLNSLSFQKQIKEDIISFVARFSPSKGQEVLIQAIPYVLEVFPNIKFYFVGSGETLLKCKELAKKLKVKENCVFLGSKPQEEVYSILSKSRVHVSASSDEAFGMVNLEAIAMKTPILAHKVGGIVEILSDSENGFFFKKNDSKDLANKIIEILSSEKLYFKLQKGCEKVFESKFLLNEKNVNRRIDLILS